MAGQMFQGGWDTNSIPSMQPEGTWRFMLNGAVRNDQYEGFGLTNDKGTELYLEIGDEWQILTLKYIDWRNGFLYFARHKKDKRSRIGFASKDLNYVFVDDEKWDKKLGFTENYPIRPEIKRMQPCNSTWVYWSHNYIYYRLNLDDKFCDINEPSDMMMVECPNNAIASAVAVPRAGNLPGGTYIPFLQLEDEDGNQTNWFRFGRQVRITPPSFKAGDPSSYAIEINMEGLSEDYSIVNIGMVKVRGGGSIVTQSLIAKYNYSGNKATYRYTDEREDEPELDLLEIMNKKNFYIRGQGLVQKGRRLILYNLQQNFQFNFQPYVDNLKVKWVKRRVAAKDAHKHTTFKYGELYDLAAVPRFCDGTMGHAWTIKGRVAQDYDREIIPTSDPANCTECDQQRWQLENTAYETERYCEEDWSTSAAAFAAGRIKDGARENIVRYKEIPNGDCENCIGMTGPCRCPCGSGSGGGSTGGGGGCGGGGCGDGDSGEDNCVEGTGGAKVCYSCEGGFVFEGLDGTFVDLYWIDLNESVTNIPVENLQGGFIHDPNVSPRGTMRMVFKDNQGNVVNDLSIDYACEGVGETTLQGLNQGSSGGCSSGNCNGSGNCGKSGGCSGGCSGCSGGCGGSSAVGNCKDGCRGRYHGQVECDEYGCEKCDTCEDTRKFIKYKQAEFFERVGDADALESGGGSGGCASGNCQDQSATPPEMDKAAMNALAQEQPDTDSSSQGTCVGSNCGGSGGGAGTGNSQAGRNAAQAAAATSCEPIPIYDETGCVVVGYEPPIYAKGEMGYWESLERYPTIKDCNGNYIFGRDAGMPIRHHLFPDEASQAHFSAFQNGVPSPSDPANKIDNDSYVYILGIEITGWENIPVELLPKPLDETSPWDVVVAKRDKANSRIAAKGILVDGFTGRVNGRDYYIPKNGLNSLELFDGHIGETVPTQNIVGYDGDETEFDLHRGGRLSTIPGYFFHSPDACFDRITNLNNIRLNVLMELYGSGRRHGLYAEGDEDINEIIDGRVNQRGVRSEINLNHYDRPQQYTRPPDEQPCDDCIRVSVQQVTSSSSLRDPNKTKIELNVSEFQAGNEPIDIQLRFKLPGRDETRDVQNSSQLKFSTHHRGGRNVNKWGINHQYVDGEYYFTITTARGCRYVGQIFVTTKDPYIGQNWGSDMNKTEYAFICAQGGGRTGDFVAATSRCIKAAFPVDADSVYEVGENNSLPICNLKRESSVYIELEGQEKLTLGPNSAIDLFSQGSYNGSALEPDQMRGDSTCDGSFLGQTYGHSCNIHRAGCWYVALVNYNPRQYGSLIGRRYVSIGCSISAKEVLCGRSDSYDIGDSYVTQYSTRRTSLITDKIGDVEQQRDRRDPGPFCNYDCGTVPESGDRSDPRNDVHMREFITNCWNGFSTFSGYVGRDTFYPNVGKWLIHFYVDSDINTKLRQRGDEQEGEVGYPNLGSLKLDSDFPKGTPYQGAYLNRFFAEQKETPGWKKFARAFLAILMFIPNAIVDLFTDDYEPCEPLDRLLQIRNCVPDCLNGDENCIVDDGKIKQFEDNYCVYDFSFSYVNDLELIFGIPLNLDTCICPGTLPLMIYSAPQSAISRIDAYRNFKINNYAFVPGDAGTIENLFVEENELYLHTSKSVYTLRTQDDKLETTDKNFIILGSGTFLEREPRVVREGLDEGFAGTVNPNASRTFINGHLFLDQEAATLYLLKSGSIKNLGETEGIMGDISLMLRDVLPLKFKQEFPMYEYNDHINIGYAFGYDPDGSRLFITKKDFSLKKRFADNKVEVLMDNSIVMYKKDEKGEEFMTTIKAGDPRYFDDVGFTISYYIKGGYWIGAHSFSPDIYAWDRRWMYSVKGGNIWRHSSKKNQTYYGKYFPWIIRGSIKRPDLSNSLWSQFRVDIETFRYSRGQMVFFEHMFTHAMIETDRITTGLMEIEKKTANNGNVQKSGVMKSSRENGVWSISNYRFKERELREVKDQMDIMALIGETPAKSGNVKPVIDSKYVEYTLVMDDEESSDTDVILKYVSMVDDSNEKR